MVTIATEYHGTQLNNEELLESYWNFFRIEYNNGTVSLHPELVEPAMFRNSGQIIENSIEKLLKFNAEKYSTTDITFTPIDYTGHMTEAIISEEEEDYCITEIDAKPIPTKEFKVKLKIRSVERAVPKIPPIEDYLL